ncbi:MAG: endo-1,4-beta-xylanase [Candidatus Hadarchaeaceae archaeon]
MHVIRVLFAISSLTITNLLGVLRVRSESSKFLGNIFGSSNEPREFSKYWNQVTPENAGKWGEVERTRDVYRWSTLDSIYNYAKSKGFPFKMHTLIWGQQQPSWINSLPREEQREEVEEWICEVGKRYPNIDFVDVVNEPIHAPPFYKDVIGGDNGLYGTGWDWVVWAFEKARQHLPNAKLLINEYGIEWGGSDLNKYITIINILKQRDLIDGIGVQGHGLEKIPLNTLKSSLDRLAQTGLPIYISEYDVDIADDNQQLNVYKTQFPVFWEHPSVLGVTLWGYVQGQTWRPDTYLLRSDGTERPALSWLMQYVRGTTPTPTPAPEEKSGLLLGTIALVLGIIITAGLVLFLTMSKKIHLPEHLL